MNFNIWSNLVIDGYKTVSEYISTPPPAEILEFVPSPIFRSRHMFESQYMVCYIKCDDLDCCDPFQTNVLSLFPHKKIPPLIPIKRTTVGVQSLDVNANLENEKIEFLPLPLRVLFGETLLPDEVRNQFKGDVPYDLFLPSVKDKVDKRCCQKCGKYHATIKSLKLHKTNICPGRNVSRRKKKAVIESDSEDEEAEVVDDLEEDLSSYDMDECDDSFAPENVVNLRPKYSVTIPGQFVQQILNLKEWMKIPWAEDKEN